MRHRSRRPVLDPVVGATRVFRAAVHRPRLALGLAALTIGGTGAALGVGATHDRPVADPSPSGTTTGSLPPSAPTDRTGQPSRGDDRTVGPKAQVLTPQPPAPQSPDQADDAATPGPRRSNPVRTRVEVHAPDASASVGATAPSTSSSAPVAAPDTTISTVSSTGSAAAFRLTSSNASTFQCSVDGASYTVCGPVLTLTGLTPGWHTVSARAVDTSGTVDPTPASTRWHANGVTLP